MVPWQRIGYLSLPAVWLALLVFRWDLFVLLLSGWFMGLYFFSGVQKVAAAFAGFRGGLERVSPAELTALPDGELPVYSIFLPVYHESAVLKKLLDGIAALDYPKEKLDVKLLLEADDRETLFALEKLPHPDWLEVITLPDAEPRTKPRACDWALERARGEFCVIYDAEDRPDADQLRKAVAVFRRRGEANTVCLQARLRYYNARQNLLTRLFAVEYITTFFLYLPGLSRMRCPVPLGGTSNHFRTAALRRLDGWDPFNVTEDCDLGMRIGCREWQTKILESDTYEEANSRVGNFLRQRSRWVKGFLQTHLVHARHPVRMWRRFGFFGLCSAVLTVGGSALMMLSNLVCWPLLLVYLGLLFSGVHDGFGVWEQLVGPADPGVAAVGVRAWPLIYVGATESSFWSTVSVIYGAVSACLLLANFLLIGVSAAAVVKVRQWGLLWVCILLPLYWVLISLGAWKGAWQLWTKPFYWEKTTHGLDQVE